MDKWETHIRAKSLKGEWGMPPATPGGGGEAEKVKV